MSDKFGQTKLWWWLVHPNELLRQRLRRLRDQRPAKPNGMREWQPIETAPLDGTSIDVWVRGWFWNADGEKQKGVEFRLPHVHFDHGWKDADGRDPLEDYGLVWQSHTEGAEITHWTPLPEPPK